MNKAYLLTGGNVGNRIENLQEAARLIGAECGKIVSRSAFYETAAWGKTDQPSFLNQALELHTFLYAPELLNVLLEIEKQLGRERKEKYGPRVIDIDVLFFNTEIHHSTHLDIPHPALHKRRFALVPLAEIAGGYIHPEKNKSVNELLAECDDPLPVTAFTE